MYLRTSAKTKSKETHWSTNTDITVTDYDGCSHSPSTSHIPKKKETNKLTNQQTKVAAVSSPRHFNMILGYAYNDKM